MNRERRRPAAIVLVANALIWVAFLLLTPPLTQSEFDAIKVERNRRDADPGFELITHEPVIVAARRLDTYAPDTVPERLLQIAAGPAIQLMAAVVVPADYGTAHATRRESHIVAAGGVILSAIFWTAIGVVVSSLVRRAWSLAGISDSACRR